MVSSLRNVLYQTTAEYTQEIKQQQGIQLNNGKGYDALLSLICLINVFPITLANQHNND